jgi:Lipid A 3-O-deacylase (PagL)
LTGNFFLLVLAVLFMSSRSYSQESDGRITKDAEVARTGKPGLRRGTNEFGVWIGYSPFSFVLKGTSKDRELFLLNLQYARTLFVVSPLTFKYTADIVPLALEFQHTQFYLVGGQPLVNPGGTLRAVGASPIGVQANIGSRRIQPFGSGSLGFLYFNRQMPVIGSSQFNYNITLGFGAQIFTRPGRSFTVGWKYHHLSNNYQAHFNPGLDSGVFYVGFSMLRAGKGAR